MISRVLDAERIDIFFLQEIPIEIQLLLFVDTRSEVIILHLRSLSYAESTISYA